MGPDRLRVLFQEKIESDSAAAVANLYRSLGLRDDVLPEGYDRRVNRSGDIHHHGLFRVLRSCSAALKATGPGRSLMELIYRRTRLRERVLGGMRSEAELPKHQFETIFSAEAGRHLAGEVARLRRDFGFEVPASWNA